MADIFISKEKADTDLLSAAAFLAERIKSADGHGEAMKSVIPLYLAKGNVDLAAELANQIDEPYARDRMLIAVAQKCAELGDDEYALQLADSVEDLGLKGQALESIALIKVGQGQIEKAFEMAGGIHHPDFVLAGIAAKQAAEGESAGSKSTLDAIDFPAAKVSGLLQIANQFIEKGETAKAADILAVAVMSANEIEHDEEKIRALCEIGDAFIEAKRLDKVIETFDSVRSLAEMLDNVHRDGFLVRCALGFLAAGSDELADRTLDLVTDKTQMASALLGFARESWNKDDKEDAVEALDEAYEILRSQRDSETRDSRSRNSLMTSIAAQFAGFGKTEKGIEAAEQNQDPEEEMSALKQIAQILVFQKEDELARQTLEMIAEDANKLFGLIGMSDVKERAGSRDDAIALLEEAATFSDSVPQLASRSSALNELALRFAEYGKADRAREISLQNLDLLTEIRDESSQAASLAAVAELYDSIGLVAGEAEFAKVGGLLRRAE
jgi:tetratricopeptide (TPR) repeat protein